ncbi:MAG: glycine--tRNA ligase [Candidatus Marinimicrobia bacterium]|nr:glycine--tRNA ligase [Candidatus Neomarinimicrobiota bacterium]
MAENNSSSLMEKVISLSKQRGFVFQSSEIYGGLKSAYDYGPLGVELKRNIMNEWWRSMVHEREDVVGIDASIIMHSKVWHASGHLAGFSDPLVDCLISKERFRADKAPRPQPKDELPIECADKGQAKIYLEAIQKRFNIELKRNGKTLYGMKVIDENTMGFFPDDSGKPAETFPYKGYVSPTFGSPFLSDERQFNLMFRSQIGPIDVMGDITAYVEQNKELDGKELRTGIEEIVKKSAVYLRPETAQAMFVQFLNCQQSMSMKVPFGIAQMGKSFRNEVTVEHFIFRSCEFEQMEMEFFVEPGSQKEWLDYWRDRRMEWWQKLANDPSKFRYRAHEKDELAHYADACYDIEYEYPWGFDELEGVASRTDYDLKKHAEHSGAKLSYFDQQKQDPETGKNGWRYTPYVIEPAAGVTRGLLVYLLDAYHEETVPNADGADSSRVVMKLHPRLSPIKVAVLPLVKKEGLPDIAREMVSGFFKAGINARYDEQHSIGKRYRRHDEAGTPYCLTIDGQTKEDGTVTIRDRDTMKQERISKDEALQIIQKRLIES